MTMANNCISRRHTACQNGSATSSLIFYPNNIQLRGQGRRHFWKEISNFGEEACFPKNVPFTQGSMPGQACEPGELCRQIDVYVPGRQFLTKPRIALARSYSPGYEGVILQLFRPATGLRCRAASDGYRSFAATTFSLLVVAIGYIIYLIIMVSTLRSYYKIGTFTF